MPITLNEIRNRAHSFVKEWDGETRERADKTTPLETIISTFMISRATMYSVVNEGKGVLTELRN